MPPTASATVRSAISASHIRAWTLSSDVGYALVAWPLTPRLGLKADIVSGDRNPDDTTLGTFNPLFPKLNYFSDANVAVPANLCDIQPTVSLKVKDSLRVNGSWNALWRYSRDDAFYLPSLKPVTTLSRASGRYLGQQWSSTVEWQLLSSITFTAGFVSFRPGSSLQKGGWCKRAVLLRLGSGGFLAQALTRVPCSYLPNSQM